MKPRAETGRFESCGFGALSRILRLVASDI
jgi:hypothetical protein